MSAPEKKKLERRRYTALKMDEISAVDRPAQADAVAVAILKRHAPGAPAAPKKGWADNMGLPAMTDAVDGHQHLVDLATPAGTTTYAKSEGEEYGHEHPFVVAADGTITIGMAEGHSHTVIVAARKEQGAPKGQGNPEDPMTTTTTTKTEAEAAAELVAEKAKSTKLEGELAEARALAEMTDAQKAHLGTLKGDERAAYVAMKADARQAIVAKAAESNAVVYTSKADGTEYRKSDDPRLVAMAKREDVRTEELATAKADRETEVLKARARAEVAHLAGDVEVHVDLLRAVDTIKDEGRRGKVLEVLKSHDAGLSRARTSFGVTERAPVAGGDPETKLQNLAKALAAKEGIGVEKAYAKVLDTPEGKALYSEHANARDAALPVAV